MPENDALMDPPAVPSADGDAGEAALASCREELACTRSELHRMRGELLQERRLSTLGRLVAGVAHEINTPVGVALTAVTHLQERSQAFQRRFEDGELQHADVKRMLEVCHESTGMIFANLYRAAELVRSFKQVAVDQARSQRRRFDLKEYLQEVLWSLQPRLKGGRHRVELVCPEGVEMDSYPGALWQIVSNLVINSVVHGFSADGGRIHIEAGVTGDRVRLAYSDDGRAIPADLAGRVFEPFFSTRHEQGSAGLGLHIAYHQTVSVLGGSIRIDTQRPRGSAFVVELPLSAPRTEEREAGDERTP